MATKKVTAKLDQIRAQIEELTDKRAAIEAAPLTRAEAEARIAAVVDAPFNDQLLDPAPAGVIDGSFGAVGLQEMLSRPALLVAAFPAQITKYLLGVYDKQLGDATPGLPASARRKRLAELATQIFKLEVDEECEIEELESQGVECNRRPEADPRAALGLGVSGAAA